MLAAKLAGDGNLRVAKYCAPSALERASCVKLLAQAAMSTNDQERQRKIRRRLGELGSSGEGPGSEPGNSLVHPDGHV